MIPSNHSETKIIRFNTNLYNSISLITENLDYEIGKAIMETLKDYKLYSKQEASKFVLTAKFISQDIPKFGANMKVKISIKYTLQKKDTNKILINEILTSSYTEKWYGAYLGSTRVKNAYEGSIKNNIKKLINKLKELK